MPARLLARPATAPRVVSHSQASNKKAAGREDRLPAIARADRASHHGATHSKGCGIVAHSGPQSPNKNAAGVSDRLHTFGAHGALDSAPQRKGEKILPRPADQRHAGSTRAGGAVNPLYARITQEEAEAIVAFAAEHGQRWRAELNTCWMTGRYHGFVNPALQRVRNKIGPSGLARIPLEQFRAIASRKEVAR
jgi:hypothetical protein